MEMELTDAVEWLRENRGFGPETDFLSVRGTGPPRLGSLRCRIY